MTLMFNIIYLKTKVLKVSIFTGFMMSKFLKNLPLIFDIFLGSVFSIYINFTHINFMY